MPNCETKAMTLLETAATIKGWIESCNKVEQLEMCKDVVEEFIIRRFQPDLDLPVVGQALTLTETVYELKQSIKDQRLLIVENKYKLEDIED
jgi:hypothetical protein